MTDIFDLSRSPIPIAPQFRGVRYVYDRSPGTATGLLDGANCQLYAYEFLRFRGFHIPDFRSSTLWDDTKFTAIAQTIERFDIILLNKSPDAYGAHVGVALGEGLVLHLSKHNALPAIETLDAMMKRPNYRHLIGAKRLLPQYRGPGLLGA